MVTRSGRTTFFMGGIVFEEVRKEISRHLEGVLRYKVLESQKLSISDNKLREVYSRIVDKLNLNYQCAIVKTDSEKAVAHQLKKHSKLKFKTSTWIGSYNFDLFYNQISGGPVHGLKGMVIEVDGGIHNHQAKMSKDQNKYELLQLLKIGLTVIPNENLNGVTVRNLIFKMRDLERIDSRARNRLDRKIHLVTIAFNFSDEEICQLLMLDLNKFKEDVIRLRENLYDPAK